MSNVALNWAFRIPVRGAAKAVLIALADHANDKGEAWPAVSRMEVWTGLKDRAIRLALAHLEGVGLVSRVGKNGTTIIFKLAVGAEFNPASRAGIPAYNAEYNPAPNAANPASRAEYNPASDAINPASGAVNPARDADKPLRTLKEPLNIHHQKQFDTFWQSYPRKVGKGAAAKAWAKATGGKSGTNPAAILAALHKYSWPSETQYIPHPATWLNQRRWEDETPANPSDMVPPVRNKSPQERLEAALGVGRPASLVRTFLAHDPEALALFEALQQQRH